MIGMIPLGTSANVTPTNVGRYKGRTVQMSDVTKVGRYKRRTLQRLDGTNVGLVQREDGYIYNEKRPNLVELEKKPLL